MIIPLLLLALAGLGAGISLSTSGPATSAATQQEVLEVIRAFNEAFAANDPERYFEFIDDAITVFTPSNPYRVEGIRADREEFEWALEQGRGRVSYFQELQPEVRLLGDVAVVTYHSRGAYGLDGRVAYLKETDVLVRRAGAWKLVHIHVSSTSP